jgi:hypothetical protein
MKSQQLQIRVTPGQKALLKRHARQAGQDVSSYVLSRVLPPSTGQFEALLKTARDADERRYALAAIHDLLVELSPGGFDEALAKGDPSGLPAEVQNVVAAMVEQAAALKGVAPPAWVRDVEPLDVPYFAANLESVRLHLLRRSPVAFRRRNVFVDATIGDRV